jgi:enamine deaminase RidA (YjgF/YER057c/UK114 family)
MVPDRPGHTNAARWALSLESDRHIDRVTVQIGAIRDRISDVDPDPKPDSPVRKLVAIKDRNILLHLDRKAHCPIDTVEYHQQGVAAGLDNSTAVTVEGWIDDLAPESTQPFERLQVIQADQAAVANHVRVDDRDKSPWIWKPTRHVRRSGHRHGGRLTGNAAGHNAIQKPPERHPSTGRPSADTWIGSPVWAHADLFDPGNRQCAVSRHQGLVIDALEGKQTMSKAAFLVPAWGAASVALLFLTPPGSTARGDEPKLSISGYDPVAYFTDGKPVPGKSDLEYQWHKLRWRFASSEHRDLFSKDPARYAPQYDGYCAMGASLDEAAHKDTVDPAAWTIVDGKLYLLHHDGYWLAQWRDQAKEFIKRADANWQAIADLPAPTIVGPPCAASPPTTSVALRDGGHWLVVGGQVARDAAGNVVGKGDMRTQIEQVGQNVDACLKAGGATVNNIVFTVSHVAAPAELDKYADLLPRYFGPPSPQSTTVAMPQPSDPDLLLEVEAIAAIK